jgi:hypothetical protein
MTLLAKMLKSLAILSYCVKSSNVSIKESKSKTGILNRFEWPIACYCPFSIPYRGILDSIRRGGRRAAWGSL